MKKNIYKTKQNSNQSGRIRRLFCALFFLTVAYSTFGQKANVDYALVKKDGSISIDVLHNDLSYPKSGYVASAFSSFNTFLGLPAHGSIAVAGDSIVYTPAAGFTGEDEFLYGIRIKGNPNGEIDSARVKVKVTASGLSFIVYPYIDVCSLSSDSAEVVVIPGGALTYSYSWSGVSGQTTPVVTGFGNGTYGVKVTNDLSQVDSLSFISVHPVPLILTVATVNNVSCYGGGDGAAIVAASGGYGGYSYTWLPTGGTAETAHNLSVGAYSVYVMDAFGCMSNIQNIVIVQPPTLTAISTVSAVSCFGGNDADAVVTVSGGTPGYTYNWSPVGQSESAATGLFAGMYTVTVTDFKGCTVTNSVIVTQPPYTCVWPGDANNDFVADNNDLLQLGLGYGISASARANASNLWIGQPSQDWADSIAGINTKYADCNGDGTVNAADTTAIVLNYGETHYKKSWTNEATQSDPTLAFNIISDSIMANATITVPITLGTNAIPAANVYGLAFSIDLDTTIVKQGSAKVAFNSSWLGTIGTNMIMIQKELYSEGRLDVGVTRVNHQPMSGSGQVGSVSIVMKDDISGKNYIHRTLTLGFAKVTMVNDKGVPVNVNTQSDSVVVSQLTTGIAGSDRKGERLHVFPNPASSLVTILTDGNANRMELEVVNQLGQTIYSSKEDVAGKITIDTKAFDNGIYLLKVRAGDKVMVQPLSVIH